LLGSIRVTPALDFAAVNFPILIVHRGARFAAPELFCAPSIVIKPSACRRRWAQ